jgi:tetratricopeptide (TPR) repeat protein
MGTTDRFTREEVQRILDLTPKQLDYWERLRLIPARKEPGMRFYDFRDLIGLRTVKQLIESGVPANRLGRALSALREGLSHAEVPLTELRVLSDGRDVVVERGGARLEPLSGQFVLNFETRELDEKIRIITRQEQSAEQWFARALELEKTGNNSREAVDAYEQALKRNPRMVDALINCGTLHYEQGNFEKASEYFQSAADAAPENSLAHSNLGSVLQELGRVEEARRHLRQAVQLEPANRDARYNLALVCDKLGAHAEAREHWQGYLQLDPTGPCGDYARQRLVSSPFIKSANR